MTMFKYVWKKALRFMILHECVRIFTHEWKTLN